MTSPSDWRIFPAAELEQGSLEWHQFRLEHFPASEVGALMGVNPWMPRNQRELFAVRNGEAFVEENFAMARGTRLEPRGRELACIMYNRDFEPAVAERGQYSASLDGVQFQSAEACDILEVKCPLNVEKYVDLELGEIIDIPEHYMLQMAQQAWCVPVAVDVIFTVYWEKEDRIFTQSIDAEALRARFEKEVMPAWLEFEGSNFEPLELDQSKNEAWCAAAKAWDKAKAELIKAKKDAGIAALENAEKAAKKALIEACEAGITNVGHGIRIGWSEVEESTRAAYITKRVTGRWED